MTSPEEEVVAPLPPVPKGLAGSSAHAGKNYKVEVSNKHGYMCHIHLEATWDVPPETMFSIFVYPDNSALFRDIKRVGNRRVTHTEPGLKIVEVEQQGELRVLWIRRQYSTWIQVTEDARDSKNIIIIFELQKSDVLGKFSGRWDMTPILDPKTGEVTGTRGILQQDILPKGMPSFMAHMPVLGGLLRGISVKAITRLMEDVSVAVTKIKEGRAAGRSSEQVLRQLCGTCDEEGFANGAVKSFAFDGAEDDDEEDGDEAGATAERLVALKLDVEPASGHISVALTQPADDSPAAVALVDAAGQGEESGKAKSVAAGEPEDGVEAGQISSGVAKEGADQDTAVGVKAQNGHAENHVQVPAGSA